MKRFIPFLICSFCLVVHCKAQQYYFKNYDVSDNLSHNTVHCGTQDSMGFMWFGTKNGLVRFDGKTFKQYPNYLKGIDTFGINNIWSLLSTKNNLWIGTFGGLFRFDLKKEQFYRIESTHNKHISKMQMNKSGDIWFISEGALFELNTSTQTTKAIPSEQYFDFNGVTISPKDQIWITSGQLLFTYDRQLSKLIPYDKTPLLSNPDISITSIASLDEERILLGTNGKGVYVYHINEKTTSKLTIPNISNIYTRDFLVRGEKVWMATESGIIIYDLDSDKVEHLQKDFANPFAISDNAVYAIVEDNSGGLWACTYFSGINYVAEPITPFKKYYPIPGRNSISGNAVREIVQDTYHNIWIGTEDGGLNTLNLKTQEFKNRPLRKKTGTGSLEHDNIHGILPSNKEIWIGTFEDGVYRLDARTGKITKHYKASALTGLNSNFVHGIQQSTNGHIYANTSHGILRYDPKSDYFYQQKEFPSLGYTFFKEDHRGGLWAGTYRDGVHYFDPTKNIKKHYKKNGENKNYISSNAINGIYEDSQDNLWITTENGLNLLEPDKEKFESFYISDGFPSNIFYTIVEDKKDSYWISTANGLVHYQRNPEKIKVYSKQNGILSNQFNYKSGFKDSQGNIYFGSGKGMISFDPSTFREIENTAEIALTSLRIKNKEIMIDAENSPLSSSIAYTNTIELLHNQSTFRLEFALLNFNSYGSIQYAYKVKGLNQEWIDLGNTNSISFTELPSGTYNLLLKSRIGNGDWSTEKEYIKIKVLPPFWASNAALLIYIILISSLFFAIFKFYHAQIEAKNNLKIRQLNNRKEKEIYEAKIKFFTNVSHEIKTPLSLIKSPLDKLLRVPPKNPELKENLAIMSKNTSRLLDLVKQLLDFRNTEMERVDLTFVQTNISELIRNTYLRFKPILSDKKLDFQLKLPNSDVYAHIDPEAVKKILSNLFNNATKYSKSSISLSLKTTGEFLILQIANDGEIIPTYLKERIFEPFFRMSVNKDKPGSGLGLSLSYSLTELHKGTLELDTSDATMNIFVLKLPLKQEKEFNLYPSNKWVIKNGKNEFSSTNVIDGHAPAILLVEDNEDLLDFVAKDLVNDYFIIKASNAREALEIIENESIQLIVSDVMMPGMDGFAFCEKIKTNIEWSHIPVILLTSKSAIEAKVQGLEAGADAYVEKPFSMDYLKLQISNLIKNREHIIDHFSSTPLAHIRSIAHTKTDENFIKKLDETIYDNIADYDLNVETLAEIMNMSRSTLYRKIKNLSNLSPNELINVTRLKKAAEHLRTGNYKIYEVAQMVGYNSATSFGRNFQKQFGMSPTEYMNTEEV